MADYTLTYFDFAGGRGEDCRLALHLAGVDFVDDRIDPKTWPERKAKTPFGALPILDVAGKGTLAQSNAILVYLGRKHGLLPKDEFEQARHVALLEACEDFRAAVGATSAHKDAELRKSAREAFAAGPLKDWARSVEAFIQGPFVAGAPLYVSDIKLYTVVNWIQKGVLDHVPADAFAAFDKLTALHRAVADHPKIQSWYQR